MSAPPVADERAWLANQVAEYEKVHARYKSFAVVLAQVLVAAARELAPLAIVQARAKAIASFAEKALRKRDKYTDPVHQFTDLCGGRVIARTRSEVEEFCRFIEAHFEIDWENSCDASQRLKPSEFGYRSIHYIVSFRPGGISDLTIPKEVLGLRAEVQVRTLVEHAYADFGHDLTYKGAFALPTALERELAGAAANLEEVDQIFSRIEQRLRAYATSYGKHLAGEAARREAAVLETILTYDPGNAGLAERLGKIAITRSDWGKAIAVLSRHVDDAHPERAPLPVLCDLGVALCKAHKAGTAEFAKGQRYLEIAGSGEKGSVDALCSLAGTYRDIDAERSRVLYRRAFQLDPADPYALGNHLEAELGRGVPVLETARPLIAKAMERCEAHITAGINLPWALYDLGKFHLLTGDPYASLDAYAKAIELSSAEWMVETSLRSLDRLGDAGRALPGEDWIRRLLVLGMAVRFESATATGRVRRLASSGCPPLRPPVRIVTGGTASDVEDHIRGFAGLLAKALAGFEGTVISGGTTEGICGLVGDAARDQAGRIHTIGYLPAVVPDTASVDTDPARYRELRRTDGQGFSPLEPLQNWIDLVASGVRAADVRVLGIGGGSIAAAEYRIGLALGAAVGVVHGSGRAAAKILADERWSSSPRLVDLPDDEQTVRAFLSAGPQGLPPEVCETLARAIHEEYRAVRTAGAKPSGRAMRDWGELDEDIKASNRAQACHISAKLREIGCRTVSITAGQTPFAFAPEEVERLAEMEHGRYCAERLLEGWRWDETRDEDRKRNPYLVAWADLPKEIRELDRQTVRKIPQFLAGVGLAVRRDG
jgi:ppGpp synthetase/RelA/SpoT-type nucleotidyltranferase